MDMSLSLSEVLVCNTVLSGTCSRGPAGHHRSPVVGGGLVCMAVPVLTAFLADAKVECFLEPTQWGQTLSYCEYFFGSILRITVPFLVSVCAGHEALDNNGVSWWRLRPGPGK